MSRENRFPGRVRRYRSAVQAACKFASAALAQQPKPPQALLDAVGRLDHARETAGSRPARGAFPIAQDFTGDSVPDHLVNEGNYDCASRPTLSIGGAP